jgi:uncharacterized protein YbaA (DUF1428 family)
MFEKNEGGAAIPGQTPNAAKNANTPEAGKTPEGAQPNDGAAKDGAGAKAEPEKGKSLAEVAGITDNDGGVNINANPDEGGKKKPTVFTDLMEAKKEIREQRELIGEAVDAIKELQTQLKNGTIGAGAGKDALDEIAEEFDLKPEFVKKFAQAIENKSAASIKKEYLTDIKDIKESDKKRIEATQVARIAKAVDVEVDRVIKANSQYAKIANTDAIKKIVMADPRNLDRSMEDIFEEVYGAAVRDTPSMDGYAGGAKNNPKTIDYQSEEGIKEVADDRVNRGEKFKTYQDDLLTRLQSKSRSRHATN